MQSLILSSAYLPPVHYFSKLYGHPAVSIEQHDHYLKQTYRNRCVIAAANGPQTLTIPVETPSGKKTAMKNTRISDHGNWRHNHWQALVSAYRTSPFFEYYADDFAPFYESKWEFLFDFNQALLQKLCELTDLEVNLQPTESYQFPLALDQQFDFRERIQPKKGHTEDETFLAAPYYQVFSTRHGFQPNLSMVDLLFNMGPESLLVLRDSVVEPLNTNV